MPEVNYRKGGEGMIQWCNDRVYLPIFPKYDDISVWTKMSDMPSTINPITGKSWQDIWKNQQEVLKEALKMKDGVFLHRLIAFCWMRGEGKSLLACLIQMWKFFNWPRQQIMLGANSKDQIKFVHFDMMRDIILNSPDLLKMVGGRRNILEKEIRIKDSTDNIRSLLRSISSFSGIVSNITGYTFSEIFDMKNPKFFVQLDGSIRLMPNALGVIDSTVSAKTHVLYQLYTGFIQRLTKTVFFSYRSSKEGDLGDYWNPMMDRDQLDDYAVKFPFGEYERYFLNLWSAGQAQMFSEEVVEEMGIAAVDGIYLNHVEAAKLLEEKHKKLDVLADTKGKGFVDGAEKGQEQIDEIDRRFTLMDNVYQLSDRQGNPRMATIEDLKNLSKLFDTDWAILAGLDFGDPFAESGLARTIGTVVAKGLPGSKILAHKYNPSDVSPKYIYVLLHLFEVPNHSVNIVKDILEEVGTEFDGIDVLCSERYGAWDMAEWCEDRDIDFIPIFPAYGTQKGAFKELLEAGKEGRFKFPQIKIAGSKKMDVFREELREFNHDATKKWFGSTEKFEKFGIQDDSVFSAAWCLYGGKEKNYTHFRIRKSMMNFGTFIPAEGLTADYK